MTDLEILKLVDSGKYRVDLETGLIYSGNSQLATYVGNDEGHLWVRLYGDGKRKAIAVHRLVWIVGSRSSIPPDFEIHHRNKITDDNRWKNLFCLHRSDHKKLHKLDLDSGVDDVPF